MGYVFISYSTKNKDFADSMRNLFKKKNISCWMAPYDIPAGGNYPTVINRAIKGCSCCVLILSNHAQNSKWVAKEMERVVSNGKSIVAVKIENIVLNEEFEFYTSSEQIVTTNTVDENNVDVQKILTAVTNFVSIQSEETFEENTESEVNDLPLTPSVIAEPEVSNTTSVQKNKRNDSIINIFKFAASLGAIHKKVPNGALPHSDGQNECEKNMDSNVSDHMTVRRDNADNKIKGYQMTDVISEESFWKVYTAERLLDGRTVTIKIIKSSCILSVPDYFTVLERISMIESNSLCKICEYGFSENGNSVYVVQEYQKGSQRLSDYESFEDYREKYNGNNLFKYRPIIGVIQAVRTLHKNNIIHGDIQPSSFIIKHSSTKLVDFDSSFVFDVTDYNHNYNKTITEYRPPEMEKYDYRSDVYSMGVMAFKWLTGYFPSYKKDGSMKRSRFDIDEKAFEILSKATHLDPQKRYQNADEFAKEWEKYKYRWS